MCKLSASMEQLASPVTGRATPEVTIAGRSFSRTLDTYFLNGRSVTEAAWREQLRGARALHLAISEIYERYAVEA